MNDDLSTVGQSPYEVPLDHLTQDDIRQSASEIEAALSDINQTLQSELSPIDADVSGALSDIRLSINSDIGQIDASLESAWLDVQRAVSRYLDSALTEVVESQAELASAGVNVPFDTDAQELDLLDETGVRLMTRLAGEDVPLSPVLPVDPGTLPMASMTLPGVIPPVPPLTTEPMPPSDDDTGEWEPIPVVAPEPPPVEPVAPVKPPSDTGDHACCCPPSDVRVTVTVPPVTVAGAPGMVATPVVAPPSPPVSPGVPMPPPPPPAPPDDPIPIEAPPIPGEPGMPIPIEAPPIPPVRPPGEVPPAVAPRRGREIGVPLGTPAYCRSLSTWRDDVLAQPGRFDWSEIVRGEGAGELAKTITASLPAALNLVTSGMDADAASVTRERAYATMGDWTGGAAQATYFIQGLSANILPDRAGWWYLAQQVAAATKAAADTGLPTDILAQTHMYALQSLAPQTIPAQGELDYLVAHEFITITDWECATRAHGNIPGLRTDLLHERRPHPSAFEVQQLRNRQSITELEYQELMRRNGLTKDLERKWYDDLSRYVPGPSDLVRFMVRDSFDDDVVRQGQLSKDFEAKFFGAGGRARPGPAAQWAAAQGMDESQMRYYWYSHWDYPSNTALYEMVHRFRPDRPEVKQWFDRHPQWKAGDPEPQGDPFPIIVTEEMAQRVIEINDMAPAWVRPLLGVSYHPITRTDAIDAYQIGAFTRDDLYHAMRDNGYSDVDAERLVSIQQTKKNKRVSNLSGTWTLRKIVTSYKEGAIDSLKADQLMTPLVADRLERIQILNAADDEVKAQRTRAWLRHTRRAYFTGSWDDEETAFRLRGMGVSVQRVSDLIDQWKAERDGRYKEPSTKIVLDWLRLMIITPQQALDRFDRMGYDKADRERLVYQGVIGAYERVEQKVDKANARRDKFLRNKRDLAKAESKAIQDELKRMEKEAEKQQKAMEKLRKELEDRQTD